MSNSSARLTGWIAEQWCAWTHGGGTIQRDEIGRINWQCSRCGRWSVPVPLQYEDAVINADIERRALGSAAGRID